MAYEPLFTLTLYSHFFKITDPTPRIVGLLNQFCYRYAQRGWVKEPGCKPALKVVKVYASRTKGNREYRFHMGQYGDFLDFMDKNYITCDLYSEITVPLYEPVVIDAAVKSSWSLRDYQEAAAEHITTDKIANPSRILKFATGQGKTVTAMAGASRLSKRIAIIILPQYIDKWVGDVLSVLDLGQRDLMTVQGSPQLKGLIGLAAEGQLESSVLIISVNTLQNFYKLYELDPGSIPEGGYDCMPEDLFKVLGVGTVIIDETHQSLAQVFKLMLYTHVPRLIALSATLISDDPMIQRVQNVMYPRETHFEGVKMKRYIQLFPVEYNFRDIQGSKIRTTEFGSTTYSHTAFEKSVLRNNHSTVNYFEMIRYLLTIGYVDSYKPGDKCIIFAATIAGCTAITNYLKRQFPQYDIRRYVEDDPYVNVIDADIRVTTVLSAGTAVDIPNLMTAIQTVCISSPVANLQSLGRLREQPGRNVKFFYTWCTQIPKHRDYHLKRLELFKEKTATVKDIPYPRQL